jgi:ribosome-binding factor A
MNHRQEKREQYFKELASEYIARESNRTSLITVTRIDLGEQREMATIFISVLPENQENAVMDFLKRSVSDFRRYVMNKIPNGKIPFFTFTIDKGEKLSRKIEELSSK